MNKTNFTGVNNYCNIDPDSAFEKTVKLMTCLVLGGFGILDNVFVIVLAVKYTVTKSLHFLIINMAVADSILVFLQLQRYLTDSFLTYEVWNHMDRSSAQILCKSSTFWYLVCATESLVTLLVISIERYKVTKRTVQISLPLSGKRRVIVIACCWMAALVLSLSAIFSPEVDETFHSGTMCLIFPRKRKAMWDIVLYVHTAVIFLLYSSLVALSILTLRRISRPQAIEDSLSEVQRQQRRGRIRNGVRMVLISLLLYSCCYIPFLVAHYLAFRSNYCMDLSKLFVAWYFLPLINSCLSPCIICLFLSDFCEAARKLLCLGNSPSRLDQRNSVEPSSRRIHNTNM